MTPLSVQRKAENLKNLEEGCDEYGMLVNEDKTKVYGYFGI